MFDSRIKAFKKLLMASGRVSYYSYRIEFQLRGMPHLHGVFWLDKEEIGHCLDENGDYKDKEITELIDKWVSCSLNTGSQKLDKLVKELNVHRHTPSCQKGKLKCRFHFPKFPSKRTLIAHPPSSELSKERLSYLEEIFRKVKTKLEELEELTEEEIKDRYQDDLDNFLDDLEINSEDYEDAISTSQKGKVVVLKRKLSERFVNNYNDEFLLAWQANMDLQFCYDGYAVITYLTDYITKVDAGLTKAMRSAIKESKGCNDFERLNQVKKAYFTHRQVSVAEATYRLTSGMDLKYSNVKSRFVATGFPENRSDKFIKVQDKEDGYDEDYDDYESESEVEEDIGEKDMVDRPDSFKKTNQKMYNLPGRQGKFTKVSTVHKKYASPPNCLENICLAQFATMFENCDRPKRDLVFNDGASDEKGKFQGFGSDVLLPKYIEMKTGGFMRQRLFPCILRIHSSKKKKQKDEGISQNLSSFSLGEMKSC